jgi:hypothetical protein
MLITQGLSNTSTIKSIKSLSIITFYVNYNILWTYWLMVINFYNALRLLIGITLIVPTLLSESIIVEVSLCI